ncbi:MAG: RtcB family protein [Clostridia bacterium]|nr:RtcB family protein [Clostridia bacterium]
MKTITGQYSAAIVYTDIIEEAASEQIRLLCDQPFTKGCSIRIMPDVHAGSGCVIGFTADLGELVIPSIVGVDIGCGMLTVALGKTAPDFEKLDQTIRTHVPAGKCVHNAPIATFPALADLLCYGHLKHTARHYSCIGTLGGGNHFIEVDVDEDGNYFLVIHTGSRNLGRQVADHYQQLAWDTLTAEAAAAQQEFTLPKALCYLTGENRDAYLHDMAVCQAYAVLNRKTIANQILTHLFGKELGDYPHFETVHNYIDLESGLIRKGAVSAKAGETLLIPINMRDGSLICRGKGNPEWNCSAPHGAGRLFSRSAALEQFTVEAYAKAMEGIYTTSVSTDTLDECPMAYKPMESIIANIAPTAEIISVIRPVYNFKAGK